MSGGGGSAPIFLLGGGQRCGSTLIQRLLNTHTDQLVWGEQSGYVRELLMSVNRYVAWSRQHHAEYTHFVADGSDAFIPNLSPPPEVIRDAARRHLLDLYAEPARALGRSIWGFKEVRYGARVALWLTDLFPDARIIHLVRDPVDSAVSMVRWEADGEWIREWTLAGLDAWGAINRSFAEHGDELERWLTVRYEDMVAAPSAFVERLGTELGIEVGRLDLSVFGRRLYDHGTDGSTDARPRLSKRELPDDVVAKLREPALVETAATYGYDLGAL